ncbi:alpha-mannosidase [Microbacterium sp. YY-01]|uniref:alpha-mannosidase n=1 Tax=Microbacterium sp. YY-01 TaxID=3421634 RepID=UPI003D1874C8
MHKPSSAVTARVRRWMHERLEPAIHRTVQPAAIMGWQVDGEPVPFTQARHAQYSAIAVGDAWGQPWSTLWLRLSGQVPAVASGERAELVIDLGFDGAQPGFQAEALVYRPDGSIVKAIEPDNVYVPLEGTPGSDFELFIEAAANPDVGERFVHFSPTALGDRATAGTAPLYVLRRCDVALLQESVWNLLHDVRVLLSLAEQLDGHSTRHAEIMRALDQAVDAVDPHDVVATAEAGRQSLAAVLAQPAAASSHRIYAVGHAHIDSAWLWPVRETQRKIARTFANVLALQHEHPEMVFAASSAQQYQWMKQHQPALYQRIREAIAAGNFVPVGSMWVESDTNLPGGEALVRQFVQGKNFFLHEFGIDTQEVWLPDSFGYTAALPQIARAAGARWMLTQKMSWNETNTMPHHTFLWEGLDGTRIFTHFPPVDTYSANLRSDELARAERQYAEKGFARSSLVPYGHGNGGGGPTRDMVAAARRLANLEGSPTVRLSSPSEFFAEAEAEYERPPVWSGEMYLEFHRGTYTSQAAMKRGNRRSEHLLREAELWATHAAVTGDFTYPYDELNDLWQQVLLLQFHDILPGTSIAWVHQEAREQYRRIENRVHTIIANALGSVAGEGDEDLRANAGPYPVRGVAFGEIATPVLVGAGAVRVERTASGITIENDHVRAVIDAHGRLSSLVSRRSGREREVLMREHYGNQLVVHRDTPTQWDAWDIDEHYRRHSSEVLDVRDVTVDENAQSATVTIERTWNNSVFEQEIRLDADAESLLITTRADWNEQQKLVKMGFALDIFTERATSEIQFGHVHRPLHTNTSWDAARFETVAHRWVHVGEPHFGVAIANDATYGHDMTRLTTARGDVGTLVRLSLVRSPLYPDPTTDQGTHVWQVSIRPDSQIPDAVAEGYRLNVPLRSHRGARAVAPLIASDNPAIVVEAVKLAEDRSGDVIVRLYEACGGRAEGTIRVSCAFTGVHSTDLLERSGAEGLRAPGVRRIDDSTVHVSLRAFEIATLRLQRSA